MKKKLLLLTVIICAFVILGSGSVFAAECSVVEKAAPGLAADDFSMKDSAGVVPSSVTPSAVTPSVWLNEYNDVNYTDWYYDYVRFMTANGMMNGYSDGIFAPNDAMTRAMVVTVLYRLDGSPYVYTSGSFYDVPYGKWFSDAVEWAASNGIVNGMGNGSFAPNAKVTREQFVTMLYRYANYKGYNTYASASLSFPDAYKLSSYANNAMRWAVAKGIIGGSQIGGTAYLIPGDSSTRAQVSKMLSVFSVEYLNMGYTDEIWIDYNSYEGYVGGTVTIYSWVAPEDAYAALTWTTSDYNVASVDSRGVVTCKKPGTATITASTFDGLTVSAQVKVYASAYDCLAGAARTWGNYSNGEYVYTFDYYDDGYFYYENGMIYDPSTNELYLYTYNEYAGEYDYYVYIALYRGLNTHTAVILLDDYYTGDSWAGAVDFNGRYFTDYSSLSITAMEVNGYVSYDYDMKATLSELLTDDVQFMLYWLESDCDGDGIACNLKDLGFVNYWSY